MNSMKFLSILVYGMLIANIGFKIYDKYKEVEPVANKPSQEPEKEVKPPTVYGETSRGKLCVVAANYTQDGVVLTEFISSIDGFVQRQLDNNNVEIECFFEIDTDKYNLTEFSKKQTRDELQMNLVFQARVSDPSGEKICKKVEYKLVKRATIEVTSHCREAQTHLDTDTAGRALCLFTTLMLVILILSMAGQPPKVNVNVATNQEDEEEVNEDDSTSDGDDQDSDQEDESEDVDQMPEPTTEADDSVDETETASQVDHEEKEVFSVPVVEKEDSDVDSKEDECNHLVDEMITNIEQEDQDEAVSSDMEMSSGDDFEHVK